MALGMGKEGCVTEYDKKKSVQYENYTLEGRQRTKIMNLKTSQYGKRRSDREKSIMCMRETRNRK